MNDLLASSLSSGFTGYDWLVVAAYLAFTTWLGARMAGKQATIRDFFLGGRKLPWYAVSGSIIATEISAVTFISVPSVVFKIGGNFTYLQLGLIGAMLARLIVGYVLVPAYYQREIYSPYDYMGNRLGGRVRSMTTVLFALGGMLAQSARVYLTAEVLLVVLHDPLTRLSASTGIPALGWAIVFIGLVAITWTLIGGITTVIWTDVILFLVFLLGAAVALVTIASKLPGGWAEIFSAGWAAGDSGAWGKFTFFDFSADPKRAYTIWTAAIASTWGGLGAYGTDQLLAQRMFCCKDARAARRAIISSQIGQVVTITVMLVGVGLYAYFIQKPQENAAEARIERHPDFPLLAGEALEVYKVKGKDKPDRIFPIFIVQAIPVGIKGLIIAGVFAAAISSLTSILAALSQTVMSAFYHPWRARRLRRRGIDTESDRAGTGDEEATDEDRRSVLVGRLLVLFWGVVLCAMAGLAAVVSEKYKSILDLALAMAGYSGGALLAGFALSFLPLKIDGRGFMYSGPLAVVCVFALVWHQPWTHVVCWAFAAVLLAVWLWQMLSDPASRAEMLPKTVILILGLAVLLCLNYFGYWTGEPTNDGSPTHVSVAWPWYAPVGCTVAFVWGYLLARRREPAAD